MANFARIRTPLGWVFNTVILDSELETIDARYPKIPNFTDGGSWSSATPVILGGAGFQTSHFEATNVDVFIVDGVVTFNNASEVFFANTVEVAIDNGTWLFSNGSSIGLTGSSLTIGATSDITVDTGGLVTFESGSALSVLSGATFNVGCDLDVTATGSITVAAGGAISAGSLQIDTTGISMPGGSWATSTGHLTMTKQVILSGSTAGIRYRMAELADANADMTVAADVYFVEQNLAADRIYTLKHTGGSVPSDGQVMTASRMNPAGGFIARFRREDGTEIGALDGDAGTDGGFIDFIYYAARGGWRVLRIGSSEVAGTNQGGATANMPSATY